MQEEIHEKQKQQVEVKHELESLKEILRSEKQYLDEIISERDKLRNLCDEKDSALQVIIFINDLKFELNSYRSL